MASAKIARLEVDRDLVPKLCSIIALKKHVEETSSDAKVIVEAVKPGQEQQSIAYTMYVPLLILEQRDDFCVFEQLSGRR